MYTDDHVQQVLHLRNGNDRYQAGWWWISIQVEVDHTPTTHTGPAIGVDLGIKSLAVTSEGEVFENQRYLMRALRTVKRRQRSVSRKVKGSANRRKAVLKLAKAHFRVVCQRKDVLHKLTTALVQQASLVGIEDLHVAGMLKNHRRAQAIADGAWAELRRQLEYKAPAFGSRVVAIGQSYSSCEEGVKALAGLIRLKPRLHATTPRGLPYVITCYRIRAPIIPCVCQDIRQRPAETGLLQSPQIAV